MQIEARCTTPGGLSINIVFRWAHAHAGAAPICPTGSVTHHPCQNILSSSRCPRLCSCKTWPTSNHEIANGHRSQIGFKWHMTNVAFTNVRGALGMQTGAPFRVDPVIVSSAYRRYTKKSDTYSNPEGINLSGTQRRQQEKQGHRYYTATWQIRLEFRDFVLVGTRLPKRRHPVGIPVLHALLHVLGWHCMQTVENN
jgi:hypothetical protein